MGLKDLFHPNTKDVKAKLSNPEADAANRSIRVFVSSTFLDMVEDRNNLMTHTWTQLRRFCRERQVELTEVDLRWGINKEQSKRNESLKLCLDGVSACQFFIGILGERYGSVQKEEAFTEDLKEEQPWLANHRGKSTTHLEILHGVLNNPDKPIRAFFYFRDPAYAKGRGENFNAKSIEAAMKQNELKDSIRALCETTKKNISLYENYSDPEKLAALVLEQLKTAIEEIFPIENIPDPLDREARDHEAFAKFRRRTYISRQDYFDKLDDYVNGDGNPLLLLGESGSGKSALIANWAKRWRKDHPKDFIFQHYIGSTLDGAVHWNLMTRLMAEIKRWTDDSSDLPRTNEDILKDFYGWLSKARIKAERDGVKFIVILDALNQLEEKDNAHTLGWLPAEPFTGSLRLIVSTLPGVILEALERRSLQSLRVESLASCERHMMIAKYLKRFRKRLDKSRVKRLRDAVATANPLYLKILLDELRVTGTHRELDKRLDEYLAAKDIPTLLCNVLARYEKDYERDRKGLVNEALGLIRSARRGLTETELLQALRPEDLPQLPMATWLPLRAALDESLIDKGGVLNFAHSFLRSAVETAFVPDLKKENSFRTKLADYFEPLPPTTRTCDELPWLLNEINSLDRLRACLLNIDRFLLIYKQDKEELRRYWIDPLDEELIMGKAYLESFELWSHEPGRRSLDISYAANQLGLFLDDAALHTEAEPLMRRALEINEHRFGKDHPAIAIDLNNLAELLRVTNRLAEAEPMHRRSLKINERSFGKDHPNVAIDLNDLAQLFQDTNRLTEAEPLMRRALEINERSFGKDHPTVAIRLNNLALLLRATNRLVEAEPLMRRALEINERSFGKDHPNVATLLNNLAELLRDINLLAEAELKYRRALEINERSFGKNHPNVARDLNNLAALLQYTNQLIEAEPLIRRALGIYKQSLGEDHPNVASSLGNLAELLRVTNRLAEAEPLMRRALEINERSFGEYHPKVASSLGCLAELLRVTNRLAEAEPMHRRSLKINERSFGKDHPNVATALNNLALLLRATNRLVEAEPLMRRALEINERSFGKDHPDVAINLSNLALLLKETNRMVEAEPLMRRALEIDERSFGKNHTIVALRLNNLALLLQATNRLAEAEPLMRRDVEILLKFTRDTGHKHLNLNLFKENYVHLLMEMGLSQGEADARIKDLLKKYGINIDV